MSILITVGMYAAIIISAKLPAAAPPQLQIHEDCCSLWQYGLWSFLMGDTKSKRSLPKNQHTQRKLSNLENWVNGEVSKIGHHFRK